VSPVRIARVGEVAPGAMIARTAGGVSVVLVNAGGALCAYEDRCAHLGVRVSEGALEGGVLTCAAHGWAYDACTGGGVNPHGARLRSLPLRIEGEDVLVDIVSARRPRAGPERLDASAVGPVFEAGAPANAAIAAMRALDQPVTIVDRGSYLRVFAPRRLRLTREAFARAAGPELQFPRDVQAIMVSFKGRIAVSDEAIVWSLPEAGP
jgi:toluene monooxygenase system ferredoxin subunit